MMTPNPEPRLLSFVIPLYNEAAVLPTLHAELSAFLDRLPCPAEIVAVNDGSTDATSVLLAGWAAVEPRLRVLELSRNFGHQAAATAGLEHARGDAVVLMDGDLQDPLEAVREMLARYREGWDVVYGVRQSRAGEGFFKRATAWLFYRLMRRLVYPGLPADAGDFRLLSRRALDALNQMQEVHRFLRGMVAWVGFYQTPVYYARRPRAAGRTHYPLRRMLHFAWNAALSFSPLPLRLCFGLGFVSAAFGLGYGIWAVAVTLLGVHTAPGWTSLVALVCLLCGSILISIGVLGEYVGRIFEQVKGRPLYVVAREYGQSNGEQEPGGGE